MSDDLEALRRRAIGVGVSKAGRREPERQRSDEGQPGAHTDGGRAEGR